MAHFADDSMQARFPKKEKIKRTPIKYYECHRCQAQDHRYADCPQRTLDQGAVAREVKKNRKNKKKGKVKIVAGIMTREQESDSTLSHEKEEGGVEIPSPQRLDRRWGYQRPLHGEYLSQPVIAPKEVMCSFCGGNTHEYRDCPVMQQYIRQQADTLAQRRIGEYQHQREWEGYEIPRQLPPHQDPLFRGGKSDDRRPIPCQGLSKQRVQEQKVATKSGMTGRVHQQSVGDTAPGGRGGTPPPGKGGPPDDKGDDESEEEDDTDDTDEETESVTFSSQVLANTAGPSIWGSSKENIKDSREGPPEDPNDPSE